MILSMSNLILKMKWITASMLMTMRLIQPSSYAFTACYSSLEMKNLNFRFWHIVYNTNVLIQHCTQLEHFWCVRGFYETTEGRNPQPLYQTIGSVRTDVLVKEHIFAVQEYPGFLLRFPTANVQRIMVLNDMRKEWPHHFMEAA